MMNSNDILKKIKKGDVSKLKGYSDFLSLYDLKKESIEDVDKKFLKMYDRFEEIKKICLEKLLLPKRVKNSILRNFMNKGKIFKVLTLRVAVPILILTGFWIPGFTTAATSSRFPGQPQKLSAIVRFAGPQ